MSSRISNNSDAKASELLEDLEEMFPWYCMEGGYCFFSKSYYVAVKDPYTTISLNNLANAKV